MSEFVTADLALHALRDQVAAVHLLRSARSFKLAFAKLVVLLKLQEVASSEGLGKMRACDKARGRQLLVLQPRRHPCHNSILFDPIRLYVIVLQVLDQTRQSPTCLNY